MSLPSFKILGASWATYQAICDHVGAPPARWRNINELAARLSYLRPLQLCTATDGNHGRAVAFMARLLGFDAHIFVPAGMAAARIEAMEWEGAKVTMVAGDYDDAVARSAQEAGENCIVVSDTSWPGYETIPAQVIEGYTTIFAEVDEAIAASDLGVAGTRGGADGRRSVHVGGGDALPLGLATPGAGWRRAGRRQLRAGLSARRGDHTRSRSAPFDHGGPQLRAAVTGRLAPTGHRGGLVRVGRRRRGPPGHARPGRRRRRGRRDRRRLPGRPGGAARRSGGPGGARRPVGEAASW